MKPSQVSRDMGIHIILYGEPKTGKSTLVSKLLLSGQYKLWWLSLDNGHEVIWKLPLTQEQLDERLELFVIPDTREFPVGLKTVRAVCAGRSVNICDIHGQAECSTCKRAGSAFSRICLDEFTSKDILVIDHAGQVSNSVTAYISIDRTKNLEEAGVYKMTLPDWGTSGAILDGIFSNIQQSKANIIVITHTVESELEDGSKRLIPQIGSGNFSRNSAKYFGHVIYLQVANKSHRAGSSTTYSTSAITGSRSDISVETQKEPDLLPFLDGRIPLPSKKEEHGNNTPIAQRIQGAKSPITIEGTLEPEVIEEKVKKEIAPFGNPVVVTKTSTSESVRERLARLKGTAAA